MCQATTSTFPAVTRSFFANGIDPVRGVHHWLARSRLVQGNSFPHSLSDQQKVISNRLLLTLSKARLQMQAMELVQALPVELLELALKAK